MSRRARVLRLACPCGRNVADVTAGTNGRSVDVKHRARLLSLPDAPSYAWACRCGDEHRVSRARLVPAYLAADAGRVAYRTLGVDL